MGEVEEVRKIPTNRITLVTGTLKHFLQESGKGFFVKKDESALALADEMKEVVKGRAYTEHFKDVIEYRAMQYYKSRYEKDQGDFRE